MKKLIFLFILLCLFAIGCSNPATVTPGLTKLPGVIPDNYRDVVKAVWILRQAGASKGLIADSDPLRTECTEPGSVYFFKDDNSLTQFVSIDRITYYDLKERTAKSCESQTLANPDRPWDYIAIDPPGPAPVVYGNEPVVPKLTVYYVSNDNLGTILWQWTATDADNYVEMLPNIYKNWESFCLSNYPSHIIYGGV